MMMGITAVGVAIKKAVFFDTAYVAADKYRYLLCGVLALTLLCMALIDMVTERHHAQMRDAGRVRMRLAGAVLVLLVASAGAYMTAFYFLLLVALCCVVQVLFDLAMAPERPEHAEHAGLFHYAGSGHEVSDTEETESKPAAQRLNPDNVIRLGTPENLRQDLYFRLMQGSWVQLFIATAVTFLLLNIFFAALYLLDPASIGGGRRIDSSLMPSRSVSRPLPPSAMADSPQPPLSGNCWSRSRHSLASSGPHW